MRLSPQHLPFYDRRLHTAGWSTTSLETFAKRRAAPLSTIRSGSPSIDASRVPSRALSAPESSFQQMSCAAVRELGGESWPSSSILRTIRSSPEHPRALLENTESRQLQAAESPLERTCSPNRPPARLTESPRMLHHPACFASNSAICTAFVAAPLRRLSLTHQNVRPFG